MDRDLFACYIFNSLGKGYKLIIPESNLFAHMDFLNALCCLDPIEWIGGSVHNKVFLLSSKIKRTLIELCDKHVDSQLNLQNFKSYIESQQDNSYLSFLRISIVNPISTDNIEEAIYKSHFNNFKDSYDITEYKEITSDILLGPSKYSERICRFCGKSHPEVKFKERNAHAIPDALGNKYIFCNDECTGCNNKLSIVEKELIEYLNVRRTQYRILNKKNKVANVKGHVFDIDGATSKLRISKFAIVGENDTHFRVKLEGANLMSHLNIYRALAKIAINLMPRNFVDNFKATIKWINGEFIPSFVPDVFFLYQEKAICQPEAIILTRKENTQDENMPLCIVALSLIDLTFIYVLPFGKNDSKFDANIAQQYIPLLLSFINRSNNPIQSDYIDMSDRIGKFAHVYEWIKKVDCEIIDQKEFENVQEKNPNKVNFPILDEGKITILSNIINQLYFANNFQKTSEVCMSDIKLVDINIEPTFDIYHSIITLNYQFELKDIYSDKMLIKIKGRIDASHKNMNEVVSVLCEEISSDMVFYMLNKACLNLSNSCKAFKNLEFDKLAELIMEYEGRIMNPNPKADQSLLKDMQLGI